MQNLIHRYCTLLSYKSLISNRIFKNYSKISSITKSTLGFDVGLIVVGACVVGWSLVGCIVVGRSLVGRALVGLCEVGRAVGKRLTGATLVGAMLLGAIVIGGGEGLVVCKSNSETLFGGPGIQKKCVL